MKRTHLRSIFAWLMVVTMLFSTMSITIQADESQVIASGSAGEGVTWEISNGTLTVSGTGEIQTEWFNAPWKEFAPDVTTIVVEEGITSIPDSVFAYMRYATSISIPSTVSLIEALAFSECENLATVIISNDNPHYKVVDNVIYSKDGKTLVYYATGKSDLTYFATPADVEVVCDDAFRCNVYLKEVTISSSVKQVGRSVFAYTDISRVNWETYFDTLPDNTFDSTNIQSFVIPDSIKYIKDNVFWAVTQIESLVIGAGVVEIGLGFFSESSYRPMTIVHYHGTKESWDNIQIHEDNEALFGMDLHFVTEAEGRDPSCADGNTDGLYCETCKMYFTGASTPAIKEHTPGEAVQENFVEADCETPASYDEVVYCTECQQCVSSHTVVTGQASGHKWVDSVCSVCSAECYHYDDNLDGDCDDCKAKDAFVYSTVKVGDKVSVIYGDEDMSDEYMLFTPPESGWYEVYSDNFGNDEEIDPYVCVHNDHGGILDSNHDFDGMGYNFKGIFQAEAGKTYLIRIEDSANCGKSFDVYLKRHYRFVVQPSSANLGTAITWDAVGAYQWYEYQVEEITDKNAQPVNSYDQGSRYVAGKGWVGDYWDYDEASYFTVTLKKGDMIYLDFGHEISDEVGMWDIEIDDGLEIEDNFNTTGRFIVEAPFDGEFEIYTEDAEAYTYLRAYKLTKEVVLMGETGAVLKNPKLGRVYVCGFKKGDVVLTSDPFMYKYAVNHMPTTSESYVTVNEGEATYQWYALDLGEELTDKNAEVVNWGQGNSSYDPTKGWSGVTEKDGSPSSYDYLTLDLKAGQTITLIVTGEHEGAGIYNYEDNYSEWEDYFERGGVYHLTPQFDGTFTVYVSGESKDVYVKAYLGTPKDVKLEGATNSLYCPKSDGVYVCDVTMADGSVERVTAYMTAHDHPDENNDTCEICETLLESEILSSDTSASTSSEGDENDTTVVIVVCVVAAATVAIAVLAVWLILKNKKKNKK